MILPTSLSGQKFSSGGDLRNCSSENFINSQENARGKVFNLNLVALGVAQL